MIAFICCSATSGFVLNVSILTLVDEFPPNRPRRSRLGYDYFVRTGGIVALLAISASAFADDRLEAGAFVGVDKFADDVALGHSDAPEQRPQTSPKVGGRVTYVFLRTGRDIRFDLGAEGELSFTPAWTGYGFADERASYFAPVFGYRADLLARFGGGWLQPHLLGGAGAATVASSSPFMKKETEPVYFWGAGVTLAPAGQWLVRFDGRQVRMNAMETGTTNSYELSLSVGKSFGHREPHLSTHEHVDIVVDKEPEPAPAPDRDSDNDGIFDRLDACPQEAEIVNGVDDGDGCPEQDPDHDNIVGATDKCPNAPEDFDKFEDDDGCPDPDNDKDGVADAKDACPNEAETKNGIADDDGCADQIPPAITAALAATNKAIRFDAGKQRLKTDTKAALDKAVVSLLAARTLKIVITAHPDEGGVDLAKKRADAVKWYLSEGGIPAANISTVIGAVAAKKTALIELSVGGL
jgi:OOP family OmpA-OmpF porin